MTKLVEVFIFLIFISILCVSAFVAEFSLENYKESVNCKMMESHGYEVKLYSETWFSNTCLIKLNNESNFIPYSKFRGYNKC